MTTPGIYESEINETYRRLAEHFGCGILPARVHKAKDKAKVEAGVLIAQRWILARLRRRRFFSLAEANEAIGELVERMNDKAFKKLPGSRRSVFLELDQPALRPLPTTRYEYDEWKMARVNIDYHVELEAHRYSVPYQLVREQVDIRSTDSTVEVYRRGKRVAAHPRSRQKGGYTTLAEHMPRAHREHAEWTPERLLNWAGSAGVSTTRLMKAIMDSKPHPQQGFRPCLGIMRLGKKVGAGRLEAACERALAIGGISYRCVQAILNKGQDRLPLPGAPTQSAPITHDNLRGPGFFTSEPGGGNDAGPANH